MNLNCVVLMVQVEPISPEITSIYIKENAKLVSRLCQLCSTSFCSYFKVVETACLANVRAIRLSWVSLLSNSIQIECDECLSSE